MSIPIVMTTYERVEYLYSTLESLEKSGADLAEFVIFDDGSSSPEKRKQLSGVAYLTDSIAKNLGSYLNCVRAITWAFFSSSSQYVFYIQDDVEFSRGWYDEAERVGRGIDIGGRLGILSLYHRGMHCTEMPYYFMEVGHPGAVAWLVARKFWREFLVFAHNADGGFRKKSIDRKSEHFLKHVCDYKICQAAQLLGFHVAYVGRSLVQHIGDVSSVQSGRDMKNCRTENYIGKKK
jgi:glycosyltransferase involved in cell wall biosynthesis